MRETNPDFILTLTCKDRRGIVHAVARFLAERGCNIEEAAQFNDQETQRFFMRVGFAAEECTLGAAELRREFEEIAGEFSMQWALAPASEKMRTVIMVSKLGHCLHDLLLRWRTGLLPIDIRAIVSNHRDFYQLAASYNIPFHHIPVSAATKQPAEDQLREVIAQEQAELVVLARYMQILSDELSTELQGRAINIHHSFLPGFKGARPYAQAYERGVKLIGATAHYVTSDLDEGPIIEQDVLRASHSLSPAGLTNLGRDVESLVLARAVKWHAERRILLNGHRTVIFQ